MDALERIEKRAAKFTAEAAAADNDHDRLALEKQAREIAKKARLRDGETESEAKERAERRANKALKYASVVAHDNERADACMSQAFDLVKKCEGMDPEAIAALADELIRDMGPTASDIDPINTALGRLRRISRELQKALRPHMNARHMTESITRKLSREELAHLHQTIGVGTVPSEEAFHTPGVAKKD